MECILRNDPLVFPLSDYSLFLTTFMVPSNIQHFESIICIPISI